MFKTFLNKDNRKYLAVIAFLLIPYLGIDWGMDNDTWFILNHGKYVLEHGIPHIEPFTVHSNLHFVMQQWMSAVLYFLVHYIFGRAGLLALVVMLFTLTNILIYKICMTVSDNNFYVSVGILFLIEVALCRNFVARPATISIVLLAIDIFIYEKYMKTQNWKYLAVLPVISCLWSNLHASMWMIQFIALLPFIVNSFKLEIGPIKSEGCKKKPILIAVICMIIAGFINPYGYEAPGYVIGSYGIKLINQNISEMGALSITEMNDLISFMLIIIVLITVIVYKKGNFEVRHILLLLGFGYMAMSARRNVFLFATGAIYSLAYYLKDFDFEAFAQKINGNSSDNQKKNLVIRRALIVLIVLAIAFAMVQRQKNMVVYPDCKQAVDYLEKNVKDKEHKNVYVGFNDGSYLEYRGFRCYIDPRAEVFLKSKNGKENIFEEYIGIKNGLIDYKNFLKKYDFDYLLVTPSEALYYVLDYESDYEVMYEDDAYKLYKKK